MLMRVDAIDAPQALMASFCGLNVRFQFDDIVVNVHSNSRPLILALKNYYKSYCKEPNAENSLDLYAIEQDDFSPNLQWQEVEREDGKTGRKELFADCAEGRWIWKTRTGMKMLQRRVAPVVVGQCETNLAQVVNFINNQVLNHYQRGGYLLGHASGFKSQQNVTAIAANSGGGKSTLMLRFLEHQENNFLTNDRLMFKKTQDGTSAIGIAKMPRINPGTLLNSNRLRHLLPKAYQQELQRMSPTQLWQLEDKYDVQIEDEYGRGRVELKGRLRHLILLDWSIHNTETTQLEPVCLRAEPAAISGFTKRRGPFFQDDMGRFPSENSMSPISAYVENLEGIQVYRLTGRVDFDRAVELFYQSALT